jgi:phage terminase large subunit-like protein
MLSNSDELVSLLEARLNPSKFAEYLGYKNAPFHETLYSHLRREECKRILAILPPGHGKSTCFTVNYPIWKVGRNPDRRFMIASHTADFVNSFIREISARMESPKYVEVFGELKPARPNKWAQNELIVKREGIAKDPTFKAIATQQATIGPRMHEIVADDIVDRRRAWSATYRADVKYWFKNELLSRLEPNGRVMVVGTRWHHLDLYGDLIKEKDEQGKPVWTLLHFPAIDPQTNKALWPERWPLEVLLGIKRDVGSPMFSGQYLGNPTPIEGGELLDAWLNYYGAPVDDIEHRLFRLPPRQTMRLYQVWDLAISESPDACYTVGLTLGLDMEQGNIYLLNISRGHWSFHAIMKRIEADALAWNPFKIGIESNGFQRMIAQGLRPKLLPIIEIQTKKNKEERIRGLSANFENMRIRIDKSMDELILEYLQFPKGETVDVLDALEMGVSMIIEESTYPRITRSHASSFDPSNPS